MHLQSKNRIPEGVSNKNNVFFMILVAFCINSCLSFWTAFYQPTSLRSPNASVESPRIFAKGTFRPIGTHRQHPTAGRGFGAVWISCCCCCCCCCCFFFPFFKAEKNTKKIPSLPSSWLLVDGEGRKWSIGKKYIENYSRCINCWMILPKLKISTKNIYMDPHWIENIPGYVWNTTKYQCKYVNILGYPGYLGKLWWFTNPWGQIQQS